MEDDKYLTLEGPGQCEWRISGSRFCGYAWPVTGMEDIGQYLSLTRDLHPKATHHCYAYRYGRQGVHYRANDDGEPSSSAGRPILGQIDRAGLNGVLVIVVRYFGGIKLGVPGLIHAYRDCAHDALAAGGRVEAYHTLIVRIGATYASIPDILAIGKELGWQILGQTYSEHGQQLLVRIRVSQWPGLERNVHLRAGGIFPSRFEEGERNPDILLEISETNDEGGYHR